MRSSNIERGASMIGDRRSTLFGRSIWSAADPDAVTTQSSSSIIIRSSFAIPFAATLMFWPVCVRGRCSSSQGSLDSPLVSDGRQNSWLCYQLSPMDSR